MSLRYGPFGRMRFRAGTTTPGGTPSGDWVSPIGIPTPDWGGTIGNPLLTERPARPADWSAEIAGYYYVDGSTGSDTGRTYGCPSAPRLSIPKTLPAGSLVEVHGTYATSHASSGAILAQGTGDAWVAGVSGPVWIVGQDNTTNRPTVTKSWSLKGSYGFLEYLYWEAPSSTSTTLYFNTAADADHWCLRHLEKKGYAADVSAAGGILIGTTSTSAYVHSYIVCYDCTLHDFSLKNATSDFDNHCFTVGANAHHIWVLDCTGYNSSGDGIQVNAGGADYRASTHHVYIGRNHYHDHGQAGIAFKYAEDCIVSENHVHDVQEASWSPSKGLGWQYDCRRVWFIFNTVHGCGYGVRGAGTDAGAEGPVYVLANLIYDCHDQGIYPDSDKVYSGDAGISVQGTGNHLHHNVIDDCDRGITVVPISGTVDITNNIVANRSAETDAWDLYMGAEGLDETIQKNLFYRAGGLNFRVATTDYATLAAFENGTTRTGNLEGDPKFVGATDFRLGSGSPGIDAGDEPDEYAAFLAAYGIDIAKDIAGTARPQGGAWDIGAYEQ